MRATFRLLILAAVLLLAIAEAAAGPAKRITVDLSVRTLTAYEGGAVVLRAPATLGTLAYPVWAGEYQVVSKVRRVYYPVGNDTHVQPWVLALDNGGRIMGRYYCHRWGHAPEHNTLTLPNAAAARLWEWADVGTPVTIH